jgi:hypothetical protein
MNDQQQLVNAIFNTNSSSAEKSDFEDFDLEKRGLAIYQRNLQASAMRALQISYPTVLKLIGDDLFAYAAKQLLKVDLPNAGDWGLWGESFPQLLNTLSALHEFPSVIDIARLDFLMHMQGREKDTGIDMASMTLLAECELDQLRLVLNPAIRILESDYPVIEIYQANTQSDHAETYLHKAQQKLANNIGQNCLIYRPQYKPLIREIDSAELNWLRLIQQGSSIGQALDTLLIQDQKFSLEIWLPLAIQQNLIRMMRKIL